MLLLIKWHGVQDFKEDDDGIRANLITSFYDFGNKTVGKYQVSCSNNLFSAKQIIYLPVWHFLLPVFLERILKMCLWIWPLHSAHYLSHNKNICYFFVKNIWSQIAVYSRQITRKKADCYGRCDRYESQIKTGSPASWFVCERWWWLAFLRMCRDV